MSSQEQGLVIAIFIWEKQARTFFHNSEFWMVLFWNHLIACVLKSTFNYVLANSSTTVHHINTTLLGEKNKSGVMT